MSTQIGPQDGVAALADVAATAPAPATRVSVAAAAKTLLLMDRGEFLSWNHSRTLRTAVVPTTAAHVPDVPTTSGTLPHGGLIRTGTALLIGLAVQKGEDPGKPGSYRGTAKEKEERSRTSVTPSLQAETRTDCATERRLA